MSTSYSISIGYMSEDNNKLSFYDVLSVYHECRKDTDRIDHWQMTYSIRTELFSRNIIR